MQYQRELDFVTKCLLKMHLSVKLCSYDEPLSAFADEAFLNLLARYSPAEMPLRYALSGLGIGRVVKITYLGRFHVIAALLPSEEEQKVLFIGPYLIAEPTDEELLEIAESAGIAPGERAVRDYIISLPVIRESSAVFVVLDELFCTVYSGEYVLQDMNAELAVTPLAKRFDSEAHDERAVLEDILMIERRYEYENQMIDAIKRGQVQKADSFLAGFSAVSFEKRLSDAVRNLKNYGVIMNTLLRKAAEAGGVHPLYIDSISSDFAMRLEASESEDELSRLMQNMFTSYARLVRRHSLGEYSPPVQKAILLIDSSLSESLSLSVIASAQRLSSGYLSALFRRECGVTITEFIAKRRIELAKQLLAESNLQIQSVALNVGFDDVQYFSKFFKKHTSKTPKEYREEARRSIVGRTRGGRYEI